MDSKTLGMRPMLIPAEIEAKAEEVGASKTMLSGVKAFVLAVLAGAFIAFGASFMLAVRSDGSLSFAVSQLLGGLVFCLGLFLVLVAGAELFTGNSLMVIGALQKRFSWSRVLRSWLIVYAGNAVGAVTVAVLLCLAGTLQINDGAFGSLALSVALTKAGLSPSVAFVRGVLCNMLVCLAVWMGFACHTVCDKLAAAVLPVVAFVMLGFEHSIANLFFLPLGFMAQAMGFSGPAALGMGGAALNLLFVTAGNVVGGGCIALAYWFVYGRERP